MMTTTAPYQPIPVPVAVPCNIIDRRDDVLFFTADSFAWNAFGGPSDCFVGNIHVRQNDRRFVCHSQAGVTVVNTWHQATKAIVDGMIK